MSDPLELRWHRMPSGLETLEVSTAVARASISLFGGQVLSWQPIHATWPVLWLSASAHYDMRKAIRGGAPVCWPWFGAHPTSASRPAHGLARLANWTLERVTLSSDGDAELVMTLPAAATSIAGDDAEIGSALRLSQTVRIGRALSITLSTLNAGTNPVRYTEGLHTYFQVGDIDEVRIEGLNGCRYADLTAESVRRTQQGSLAFDGETARLFVGTDAACSIVDPGLGRRIRVEKTGSRSTAVWNPGAEVASRMADLGPTAWRQMVCVETANALDDTLEIGPGEHRRMTAHYSVEPLN